MAIMNDAKRITDISIRDSLNDNDCIEIDNEDIGGASTNLLSLARYLGNGLLAKQSDITTLTTSINTLVAEFTSYKKQRIGTMFSWLGITIPEGSLELNGAKLNISDYQDLFNLQLFKDNGDGTFTLPDPRDRYLRGASDTRKVLGTEEDAIQNITANFTGYDWVNGKAGGAVKRDTTSNQTYDYANDNADNGTLAKLGGFSFDASRVVRTADETRVKGLFVKYCIWYK